MVFNFFNDYVLIKKVSMGNWKFMLIYVNDEDCILWRG